ncbi:hypothetical protein ES702_05676 [subsurface metagenome]
MVEVRGSNWTMRTVSRMFIWFVFVVGVEHALAEMSGVCTFRSLNAKVL